MARRKPVKFSYEKAVKRIGNKKYSYGITATITKDPYYSNKRYFIEDHLSKSEAEKLLRWIKTLSSKEKMKYYGFDFKNPRVAKEENVRRGSIFVAGL